MSEMKSIAIFYNELKTDLPELQLESLWALVDKYECLFDSSGVEAVATGVVQKIFGKDKNLYPRKRALRDFKTLIHSFVEVTNSQGWKVSNVKNDISLLGGGILPLESVFISSDSCAALRSHLIESYHEHKLLMEFYSKQTSIAFIALNEKDQGYARYVSRNLLSPDVRSKIYNEPSINKVSESTLVLLSDGKGIVLRNSSSVAITEFDCKYDFDTSVPAVAIEGKVQ